MSWITNEIETPDGVVRYSVSICDGCGKRVTGDDRDGWIRVETFFERFEFMWQTTKGLRKPAILQKDACSVDCWRPLMDQALDLFGKAWKDKYSLKEQDENG